MDILAAKAGESNGPDPRDLELDSDLELLLDPPLDDPLGDTAAARPVPPAVEAATLRDYFAAQALIGFVASHTGDTASPVPDEAADRAFRYADAMLRRRGQ